MTNHYVRENETGYQDFTLYDENGLYNGTGTTVVLTLLDRNGGQVDMTSKCDWLVAASGTVRVSPAVGDLKADLSPYSATFVVTLSARTYAFPSAPNKLVWQVWK
jgi:hypothetical protein